MSGSKIAPLERQPARFAFTPENLARARRVIAKYPAGRQQSAVLPLLDLAQRQHGGWLPEAAVRHVAELLEMPYIRAWEVATFYTMHNLAPVGRHLIQVCTTTPCWLRDADAVVKACARALAVHAGETTADGRFTWREVECLGACVNAPVVQIGDDYYEDVDGDSMTGLIEALRRGEKPEAGSQIGRLTSAPVGGPTTLQSVAGGDD